jgi:nitrite reductase/ring-hydroxylating ferredoxin subunit/uncharacterized membrane protein
MWKIESQKDIHQLSNEVMQQLPELEEPGLALARSVHYRLINSGEAVRNLADFLHGSKWLGHPLHPVLTDVTLGAWMMGLLFDVLSLLTLGRWKNSRSTGDSLVALGTITAIPTAIAGFTDYTAIKKDAAHHGALHGLMNTIILGLYVLSVRARRDGYWFSGILYSTAALGMGLVSAWLGGELVYNLQVGVNHAQPATRPTRWMPALPEADLQEGQPRRVKVEGQDVLLYRKNGVVYAVGAVCSHAGGPLEEGQFYDYCVQCPWHDSVYDLRDGSVVHGPTTYNQPVYQVRVMNGTIEVQGTEILQTA